MTNDRDRTRLREVVLPVIIAATGLAALVGGAIAFVHRGDFGWIDGITCAVMLVPASALLLVTSYVIQHARVVAVMPLVVAGLLVIGYPSFAVAFGLVLIGAIAGPLASEWGDRRRQPRHGGRDPGP